MLRGVARVLPFLGSALVHLLDFFIDGVVVLDVPRVASRSVRVLRLQVCGIHFYFGLVLPSLPRVVEKLRFAGLRQLPQPDIVLDVQLMKVEFFLREVVFYDLAL